jgi:hypothetical protein
MVDEGVEMLVPTKKAGVISVQVIYNVIFVKNSGKPRVNT